MAEGDIRSVKPLGLLGCQYHFVPYVIWEIETIEGASRRFIFLCPVEGCGQGLRVTTRQVVSVCIHPTPDANLSEPPPSEELLTSDEKTVRMVDCPCCRGRGRVVRPHGEVA